MNLLNLQKNLIVFFLPKLVFLCTFILMNYYLLIFLMMIFMNISLVYA